MPSFLRHCAWLVLLVVLPHATSAAEETPSAAGETFFENKIRPVLAAKCFDCHAADSQEAGLRLDRRNLMLRGGRSGKSVLPGDPDGSLLIRVIRRVDRDLKMPPEDDERLTPEEVENFIAWIKMGAPFPAAADDEPVKPVIDLEAARKFWSFKPLHAVVPTTGAAALAANPIDRFLLQKLEAAGMKPSPTADKRTLIRRVTYDLTGLPPTPEEVAAFLADPSPDAFASVVERLLDSPQYGVQWGRHWLDVARYGDTRWVGAGEDKRWPFAYTYRDWVIQAINDDMPYDRFVTLQLAADQMPDARPADQAALGFLTVGRWFTGKMPDVIDDQIDVVTRGLLGLSVQCARCHNHKYDPITSQDYYSLYGLFAAMRMPVDGSGLISSLPEVSERPVDAALEGEVAALRAKIDEFLTTRIERLRDDFRKPETMKQYLLVAQSILAMSDNDARAFAKTERLDERLLLRWTRYLKNTAKSKNPALVPWHALASLPEAEFAKQAPEAIKKLSSPSANRYALEILAPAPQSLTELAERYVSLMLKFDGPDLSTDREREQLRQVMRSTESPPLLPINDLVSYLTEDEKQELLVHKRALTARLATLPEHADLYLSYRRDIAPSLADFDKFIAQRRAAVEADLRSPEKIAGSLLTAEESKTLSESQFRSMVKTRQLSADTVRKWVEYLRDAAQQNDDVFGPWRVFVAADEQEFTEPASAQLAERARRATNNRLVAAMFETPPTSRAEVAQRYAELIARYDRAEPYQNPDEESLRQVTAAADSPLRFIERDVVNYLTQKDNDELKNLERKIIRISTEAAGSPPRAMIVDETSRSYAQRVFIRGNPGVPGEPAHGGFLSIFSSAPEPQPFAAGKGRWELARAIVDPSNATAARVIVNRVWQWHFGTGLVATPSDFGIRGSEPSHPELLDWLAQTLIDDGWSLKKLHRRILSSAAWRQSSADQPKYRQLDPDNRLVWRMNRHRLGLEELRDSLLAAAGRLDTSLDGRAVDLTKTTTRRRTAYGTVDRVTLPGFYRYFDFPGSEAHTPERQETIVAQQALYLMNSPFVMEQAEYAASRTAAKIDPVARIEQLYSLILGRSPTPAERELGLSFVRSSAVVTEKTEPDDAAMAQPADPWQYGWGKYDEYRGRVTDFYRFPFFGGNQWKGGAVENDPVLGRASLNSRGGYAGPTSSLCVIRRWTAPRSGPLSITGLLSVQPTSLQPTGDGVRARIVSSRHGQLGVWIAYGTEETTRVDEIDIQAGDTIDFVVDGRGRDQSATFVWAPIVRQTNAVEPAANASLPGQKSLWDAAKDFKGTTAERDEYDVWGRYAQVLLETNEFLFVD